MEFAGNLKNNNLFDKENAINELNIVRSGKLPFGERADGEIDFTEIDLKDGQIIFASLNNVFNRFIDNDIYNEFLLKNQSDNETLYPGPSIIDDPTEILNNGLDNAKYVYFDRKNGETKIVRRHTMDLNKTKIFMPFKDSNGNDVSVNFIDRLNGYYVAGTSDGFWYTTHFKREWKKCDDSSGRSKKVGKNFSKFYGKSVVALTVNQGFANSDSVLSSYQYIAATDDFKFYGFNSEIEWEDIHSLDGVSQNKSVKRINKLYSDEDTGKLYIMTNAGTYEYYGKENEQLRFAYGLKGTSGNDFVKVDEFKKDGMDKLVATSNGIKQSYKAITLNELENLHTFSGTITTIFEAKGNNFNRLYVGTSNGLYASYLNSNEFSSPNSVFDGLRINALYFDSLHTILYVSASRITNNNGNSTSEHKLIAYFPDTNVYHIYSTTGRIIKLGMLQDVLVLAENTSETSSILRYAVSTRDSELTFKEIDFDGKINDVYSGKGKLFVVTTKGIQEIIYGSSQEVFMTALNVFKGKNVVFGKQFDDSAYVCVVDGNNFKLYDFNAIIESNSFPDNCFVSNARVIAIDKTDDSGLIVATENGIYLISNTSSFNDRISLIPTNGGIESAATFTLDESVDRTTGIAYVQNDSLKICLYQLNGTLPEVSIYEISLMNVFEAGETPTKVAFNDENECLLVVSNFGRVLEYRIKKSFAIESDSSSTILPFSRKIYETLNGDAILTLKKNELDVSENDITNIAVSSNDLEDAAIYNFSSSSSDHKIFAIKNGEMLSCNIGASSLAAAAIKNDNTPLHDYIGIDTYKSSSSVLNGTAVISTKDNVYFQNSLIENTNTDETSNRFGTNTVSIKDFAAVDGTYSSAIEDSDNKLSVLTTSAGIWKIDSFGNLNQYSSENVNKINFTDENSYLIKDDKVTKTDRFFRNTSETIFTAEQNYQIKDYLTFDSNNLYVDLDDPVTITDEMLVFEEAVNSLINQIPIRLVSFTDDDYSVYLQTLSCDCSLTSCTDISETFAIPNQTQTSVKYAWYKLEKSGNVYSFSPYTTGVTPSNAEWPFNASKQGQIIDYSKADINFTFDCVNNVILDKVAVKYNDNSIQAFFVKPTDLPDISNASSKCVTQWNVEFSFADILSSVSNAINQNISCDGDSTASQATLIGKNNVIDGQRKMVVFPNTQDEREYSYDNKSIKCYLKNLAFENTNYNELKNKKIKISLVSSSGEQVLSSVSLSDETYFEPYNSEDTVAYSEFEDLNLSSVNVLRAKDNLFVEFNPYKIDTTNSTNEEYKLKVSVVNANGSQPTAVNINLMAKFAISLSIKSKTRKRFFIKTTNAAGVEQQIEFDDSILFTKFNGNVLCLNVNGEFVEDQGNSIYTKTVRAYSQISEDFLNTNEDILKTELLLQNSSDTNANKTLYLKINDNNTLSKIVLSDAIDKIFMSKDNTELFVLFLPSQNGIRKLIRTDITSSNWINSLVIPRQEDSSIFELPQILCYKKFIFEFGEDKKDCILFGTESGLYLLDLTTLTCAHLVDSNITNSTAVNSIFSYEDEFKPNRTLYCSINDNVISIAISKDTETDNFILSSSIVLQETEENIVAILHSGEFSDIDTESGIGGFPCGIASIITNDKWIDRHISSNFNIAEATPFASTNGLTINSVRKFENDSNKVLYLVSTTTGLFYSYIFKETELDETVDFQLTQLLSDKFNSSNILDATIQNGFLYVLTNKYVLKFANQVVNQEVEATDGVLTLSNIADNSIGANKFVAEINNGFTALKLETSVGQKYLFSEVSNRFLFYKDLSNGINYSNQYEAIAITKDEMNNNLYVLASRTSSNPKNSKLYLFSPENDGFSETDITLPQSTLHSASNNPFVIYDDKLYYKPGGNSVFHEVDLSNGTNTERGFPNAVNGVIVKNGELHVCSTTGVFKTQRISLSFGKKKDSEGHDYLITAPNATNYGTMLLLGSSKIPTFSYEVEDKDQTTGVMVKRGLISSNNEALDNMLQTSNMQTIMLALKNNFVFISDGINGKLFNSYPGLNAGKNIQELYMSAIADFVGQSNMITSMMYSTTKRKTYFGYGNNLLRFNNYAMIDYYSLPNVYYRYLKIYYKKAVNRLYKINKDNFLVGTNNGVRYYKDNKTNMGFISRLYPEKTIKDPVSIIGSVVSFNGVDEYIVASKNKLYHNENISTSLFEQILELDEDEKINCVSIYGLNEYLIGTNKGIYATSLQYELLDEMHLITFKQIQDRIDEVYGEALENHIAKDHNEDCLITKLANKMSSNLEDFPKSFVERIGHRPEDRDPMDGYKPVAKGIQGYTDDIVETIEFDDVAHFIRAGIKNWVTDSIYAEAPYSWDGYYSKMEDPNDGTLVDLLKIPYICKYWLSGMKEIYVQVPTTMTYYMNNPYGFSQSEWTTTANTRMNLLKGGQFRNFPWQACTKMRLYLDNTHFKINQIRSIEANGNSLPLKIYMESEQVQAGHEYLYDSVVQPTVVRTLPRTTTDNVNNVNMITDAFNRICLDFSIYGTDAQSIKIIAE